jgi:MFS family permease
VTGVRAQPAAFTGGGLRRVLAALCLTQVTSWGILYYAFPVLSGGISADTGWAASMLAAAFSAGLVVAAVLGVVVGRWLDRHGPRWLMSIGSLVGVAAVVAIAWAPTVGWFAAAWLDAAVAVGADQGQLRAAGSSSAINVCTRLRISSRIGRTESTPLPAGSSSTQSSYRLPG